MSVLGTVIHHATILRPMGECGIDSEGTCVTKDPFIPEFAELLWGGLASLIIFYVLYKFGKAPVKAFYKKRTDTIQKDLDAAASDAAAAATESAQIRQAKGDIAAERARILADADTQAASLLEDGRARLQVELAELEAKADADIAAAGSRVNDELRAEIARLSNAAVDHVVSGSLDDATQQELIETFISRVGASS